MTITELAQACRREAEEVVKRHQKLSSLALYRVLARCLELSEACRVSNDAHEELRDLVKRSAPPGKRSYVELASDEFTLSCRYVFAGDESHANVSRYSHALREAKKLQLTHSELFEWLKENGGVNALYMRRPVETVMVTTKTLRLDRSITIPRDGKFTITLIRGVDNVFRVQDEEI